jgi:transcriptional regulator with XRE-family HTH domain
MTIFPNSGILQSYAFLTIHYYVLMENKIKNTITEYRVKAGISQNELARRMGFKSNNRISRWENGLARPSSDNLLELASILNIDPRLLYPKE